MGPRRYQTLSKFQFLHPSGDDLLGLFYPRCCVECGDNLLSISPVLCPKCLTDLPRCGFAHRAGNRLEELFYGRVRIEAAASYLYFRKHSIVQRVIHQLKYQGRQDIGEWIANLLANEMLESDRFESIDVIIPVPLHPKKKRRRGYNQVSRFGKVLADRLGIQVQEDALIRCHEGKSLTRKNRIDRNESMRDAFSLPGTGGINGKHVLLVDDIITSGATLEACANKILDVPGACVSLASMAFTL